MCSILGPLVRQRRATWRLMEWTAMTTMMSSNQSRSASSAAVQLVSLQHSAPYLLSVQEPSPHISFNSVDCPWPSWCSAIVLRVSCCNQVQVVFSFSSRLHHLRADAIMVPSSFGSRVHPYSICQCLICDDTGMQLNAFWQCPSHFPF